VALFAGAYALASWICGLLTDAGIAAAISAAAVLAAEGIGYCQRRNQERARRTRAEVWQRRDRYTLDDVVEAQARLWGERKPVATILTYNAQGEPICGYDSQGHSAVWPFEVGSFE
jgi:hypothetical protein